MKVVSRYCDSCGVKIPATDIQDEIALKYEESYYCKECKAEILPLIEKKGAKGATPKPGAGSKANGNGAKEGAGGKVGERSGPVKVGEKSGATKRPTGERPAVDPVAKTVKVDTGKTPAAKAGSKPGTGTGSGSRDGSTGAKRPLSSGASRAAPTSKSPAVKSGARKPADEDLDDDADSEEELDAEEAPKKRNLVPIIGVAILALATIGGVAYMLKGNGSGEQAQVENVPKKAVSDAERNEKLWAQARAGVKDRPLGEQIKALKASLDGITDQKVMDKAEAEIEALDTQYTSKGKEAFERLNAKAREQSEVGAYDEAIATLRGFPEDLRDTPWYKSNVLSEISKYERNVAAKSEAEPLIAKAEEYARAKEFQLAIGVLEGFDAEEYRSSPYVAKIEKLKRGFEELATLTEQGEAMDEITRKKKEEEALAAAEAAKKRAEEDKRIAGLMWEKIPTDDLFTWKTPEPAPADAWKCTPQKELTGKSGGALPSSQLGAMAGCGNKNWIDYIFEFRYKVVKGNFRMGVRSTSTAFVELQPETIADNQWHAVQISVRGTGEDAFQQIVEGISKKIKFDAHDSMQGGIAFCLLPNSECVFTDVRIKVINKASGN